MKIKQYLSVALVALAGVAISGCDGKEEPEYAPATKPAEAQRVYFAKASMSTIVAQDQTVFIVPLYRPENADASELTVELTTTDESGLFSVPANVTFAAGQASTQIPVSFTTADMTPNTEYPVVIAVDEANADVYGLAEIALTINFEQMTEWALFGYDLEKGRNGYGVWTLGSPFSGNFVNMRVFERHIPSNPDNIQYAVQLNIPGNLDGSIKESEIDTSNTDFTSTEWLTAISMSSSDGGKTIEIPVQQCVFNSTVVFAEASVLYPSSFPDNKSTFDEASGTFSLNLMYADDEGAWNPAINPITLYGYADTNEYSLKVTDYSQVEIDGKDYAVINFAFSPTIEYVNYTIVEGELDEEQIAAVIETMQDEKQETYVVETIAEPGNVTISFPSSGTYTVVAAGIRENTKGEPEVKATASVKFEYETFNPYYGWTTLSEEVAYTDNIMSSLFEGLPAATYNVEVAVSDEYEGLYRITNPYVNYPYLNSIGATLAPFGSIEFDASLGDDKVLVTKTDLGLTIQGFDLSFCSYAYYLLATEQATVDEIPAPYWGTMQGTSINFAAIGVEEAFNFILFGNGQVLLTPDMPLGIDLAGAPAAKPAAKVSAIGRMVAKSQQLLAKPMGVRHFTAKAVAGGNNGKVSMMKDAPRR